MNQFLTKFLEYKIINLLCVDYILLLPGKTLSNYTNLFSPNEYKKNDKIICKYFKAKHLKSQV